MGAAGALVVAAALLPPLLGLQVLVGFPPLHGQWMPRVGPGTLPAVVLAVLAARHAVGWCATARWDRLLLGTYAASLAWIIALAAVDGRDGIGRILQDPTEYLPTARAVDDIPALLRGFTGRIPFGAAPENWPVHVAGHPPGALLVFVVLVRLGLGGGLAAGLVVSAVAASTVVAVAVTVRVLGDESAARRAAPFLVFAPAAIWQGVSADGLFAAVAAWGVAALAAAARSPRAGRMTALAIVAGLLLGCCVLLSYGLPLLGVAALTVLVVARSWRPLVPAGLAALGVLGLFAAYGYNWLEALPVLRERYWAGIARRRPTAYWIWADLAAVLLAAGPVAAAGLARAGASWRDARRPAVALPLAGAAMVLLADLSLMSKAEVERIWLPFVPWVLVAAALLPGPWRRRGLAAQLVLALLLQHLLHTPW